MSNFFDELKRFIEMCQNCDTDGLVFNFDGAIIPYHIAEMIYARMDSVDMWEKEMADTIDEQSDFIRLLREENKRLRGLTDE